MLVTLAPAAVLLRYRFRPERIRTFFEAKAWKEAPFCLWAAYLFTSLLGLYLPSFFIQLYGTNYMGKNVAFYLLPVLNSGSFFGRPVRYIQFPSQIHLSYHKTPQFALMISSRVTRLPTCLQAVVNVQSSSGLQNLLIRVLNQKLSLFLTHSDTTIRSRQSRTSQRGDSPHHVCRCVGIHLGICAKHRRSVRFLRRLRVLCWRNYNNDCTYRRINVPQ